MDSARTVSVDVSDRQSMDDDSVASLCRMRLRESPYAALRELECRFRDGVVTLRGVVPTFHTKQVAYAVLLRVKGVYEVVDCIKVSTSSS